VAEAVNLTDDPSTTDVEVGLMVTPVSTDPEVAVIVRLEKPVSTTPFNVALSWIVTVPAVLPASTRTSGPEVALREAFGLDKDHT
jgi:hypothetical protein